MLRLEQHLRHSLLSLRKNPGLTAIVLLTLALGIGANTAIFTVDYATLLAPLPYREPDRLVAVWSWNHDDRDWAAAGDFLDWTRQAKSLQELNAVAGVSFNIASREQPENVAGQRVTVDYYGMLGQRFALGRDFLPEEGERGKDHEAILTNKQWQSMGANPHIVGTTMRLDGEPYTVVGVLAAGIADREPARVIVPLVFTPEQITYDFHWLTVSARLKPGVSIKQAQADMAAVASRIADLHPERGKDWEVLVEPLKNDWWVYDDSRNTLRLLLGAVGFVLLIACVNVINLLLAKNTMRQREIAIRGSLGATPGAIFAHLLTESLLLAAAGGVLGVLTGYAMLHTLLATMPPSALPAEADVRLNPAVLLFTLSLTTVVGLLVGCAPAWLAARVDPVESLKEGGRSSGGVGSHRLRQGLVVGEFALAIALLAGAGLAIHSFLNLERINLGVRTDRVFTVFLPVPDTRSKDPVDIIAYYHRVLASVETVPGVSSAAVSSGIPLIHPGFGTGFSIAGQPAYSDPSKRPFTTLGLVTPDYFKTYGVRLVKGRAFTDRDTRSSVPVAVVNQFLVDQYLKGVDPLGQRILVDEFVPGGKKSFTVERQIVGVFSTVRYDRFGGLRQGIPEIDVPFWQEPSPRVVVGVRSSIDPQFLAKSIAAAVHAVDPDVAVANPQTMDQVRSSMMSSDRFTFILFTTFAAIALLLASIGIYGVTTFSVGQRLREMAIRSALGASRLRVIGLVVNEGLALAGMGLGVGLVGAYFVGRLMKAALFGVGAIDVPAFGLVGLLLLGAALVACFVPAYRAASMEPLEALRGE